MTYQELYDILAQTGLPMALHHWEHPPKPPYGVYYDDYTNNFAADNIAYHVIQHVWVELYAPRRSREAEEKIEAALTYIGTAPVTTLIVSACGAHGMRWRCKQPWQPKTKSNLA